MVLRTRVEVIEFYKAPYGATLSKVKGESVRLYSLRYEDISANTAALRGNDGAQVKFRE